MSKVIFLDRETFAQAVAVTIPARNGRRVYARETHSGVWIVHDEMDRKGGCFRDRHTAFDFIEDEFGADAEVVIQPRFSSPATRHTSHFAETSSVAHRAVTAR